MPANVVKLETPSVRKPVLVVGMGRGGGGKSTGLAEMAGRAKNAGRELIVADGDLRSRTLSGMFQEATSPTHDEPEEIKIWLTGILNRMLQTAISAVLDLGSEDRVLKEYGRDLRIVEFCKHAGIEPCAVYYLGPDLEDLRHVLSIYNSAFFRPERTVLVFNEGVVRVGQSVANAYAKTLDNADLKAMLKESGAKILFMERLACMPQVRQAPGGFYGAQGLDPVSDFMLGFWRGDLERKRVELGIAEWLP